MSFSIEYSPEQKKRLLQAASSLDHMVDALDEQSERARKILRPRSPLLAKKDEHRDRAAKVMAVVPSMHNFLRGQSRSGPLIIDAEFPKLLGSALVAIPPAIQLTHREIAAELLSRAFKEAKARNFVQGLPDDVYAELATVARLRMDTAFRHLKMETENRPIVDAMADEYLESTGTGERPEMVIKALMAPALAILDSLPDAEAQNT